MKNQTQHHYRLANPIKENPIDKLFTGFLYWKASTPGQYQKLLIFGAYVSGGMTMLLIYNLVA